MNNNFLHLVYNQGIEYRWEDLCLKYAGNCVDNSFLSLHNKSDLRKLSYPVMTDPHQDHVFHPMMLHFGGVETGEGRMRDARAMKLIFMFDHSTKLMTHASSTFINAIKSFLDTVEMNSATLSAYSPLDTEKELINNIQTAFNNNFSVIIIIICSFTLYSCMRTDWVRSKPLLGVVGLLCIILAAVSGEDEIH